MKYLLIITMALTICAPSWACEPQCNNAAAIATGGSANVKSTNINNNRATSTSSALSGSSSASDSTSHTGDNTITMHTSEHTQFSPTNTSSVRIGAVSKPVPQVYIQGQTEDDYFSGKRSNAIQAGVSIPITWGTGVNGALATESQHLKDRNLHEREIHQAEMARVCMELHKYILSTGADMSPELWSRCKGFEHSNNERTNHIMEGVYPPGRHNQEMNERQISPHNEEYHR